MNVKELKELLATLDDDTLVVLSKDGEGNSYSPLSSYNTDYRYSSEEGDWHGEVVSAENCDDERELYGEEGPCDHSDCRWSTGVKAVVFWPVN